MNKTNLFKALLLALVGGTIAFTACSPTNAPTPNDKPTENPGGVTKLDKSSGCLNGSFSVAKGKYVRFSMGNLQYMQSTQTWSFAAQQYEFIGTDNVEGGNVTYDVYYGYSKSGTALADKIDLFGWSGSTGAAWGISTSENDKDYSDDFKDWGQNVISNGGNKANQWRTLTYEEWNYLITDRANASSLQGVASVNGVNGLILLPDGWQQSDSVSFKSSFASERNEQAYADYQILTFEEWSKLEKSGAVFLPASGYRYGLDVYHVGNYGNYRSATPYEWYYARFLCFYSDEARMSYDSRLIGQAVRLVQDVK